MPTKPHTSKDFNQDLWICLWLPLPLSVKIFVVSVYERCKVISGSLGLISLMSISALPSHGAIIGSREASGRTALSSPSSNQKSGSYLVCGPKVTKFTKMLQKDSQTHLALFIQIHQQSDMRAPPLARCDSASSLLLLFPHNSATPSSQPRSCQYYR